MRAVAVIGDIHGDDERLATMLADPELSGRELVFIGDYINRGPASKSVISRLTRRKAAQEERVTFLRGNHEEAFVAVLEGGPVTPLLLMGGSATVRSWVPEVVGDVGCALRDSLTEQELRFFMELETEWLSENVRVTHEKAPTQVEGAETRLLIVGHYIQRDRVPKIVDGCAYLDTGCGSLPDGRLSALLLPELRFVTH